MSLTVNANPGTTFEPVPQGTHLAVCAMIVDLGVQFNKSFGNSSRKVLLGWELPEETYEVEGEKKPKMVYNRYTASLNESSNLRRDLAAWRGRDFTEEELLGFDLANVAGASCYLNIIHKESNGRTYANISSIMALPKNTPKGKLSEPALIFNLDTATDDDIEKLPEWIKKIVKESVTYKERTEAENQVIEEPKFQELDDEVDLPF